MSITPQFMARPAPQYAGPQPIAAMDVTCEGLWVLQALCGVEQLPAVLVARPFTSDGGPPADHPGIGALREAGAIIGEGAEVHPQIQHWLEALGAPDLTLCCTVRRNQSHLRMAIARRGTTTVAAVRCEDDVCIEEVGAVRSMRHLLARILPVCGPDVAPARFDPVPVPTADLLDGLAQIARGEHTPSRVFAQLGLDHDQRRVVTAAADNPKMELSMAVVRHGDDGDHVGLAAVSITDTTAGRIVTGPIRSESGAWWTMLAPGTLAGGERALNALLETLEIPSWEGYRSRA